MLALTQQIQYLLSNDSSLGPNNYYLSGCFSLYGTISFLHTYFIVSINIIFTTLDNLLQSM